MRIDGMMMDAVEGPRDMQQQQQQWQPGNISRQPTSGHHNNNSNHYNNNNNNNTKTTTTKSQDKNLQEFRAFALEYVKQIVAKASELSQERQELKQAQKLAQFYTGGQSYTTQKQDNGNSRFQVEAPSEGEGEVGVGVGVEHQRRRLREAASQITERFPQIQKQFQFYERRNKENFHPKNHQERVDKNNKIILSSKQVTAGESAFANSPSIQSPYEAFNSNQRVSNLLSEGRNTTREEEDETINGGGDKKLGFKKKRERRGIHHRLNWHLLVSCFSTCLPQTLVDTIPSNGGAHSSRVDPTSL